MTVYRLLTALACVAVLAALGSGGPYDPPPPTPPGDAARKVIEQRLDKLESQVAQLRRLGIRDPILADVEIYHKAARWVLRHNEFYGKKAADWTLAVLDRGLLRASQAARGEAPWLQHAGRAVVRAYRSELDGSLQPYAVTYPPDYGKQRDRKWRLDIVLHGRDSSLTEVKFLHTHDGSRDAPADQDYVQLEVYGRGNNAYRWAGESDIIEAYQHLLAFERIRGGGRLPIDLGRVVLRGFSMGGAGTWHFGLHRPDQFCVLGPGAGFTTTHGYARDVPAKLPPYQEACLRIYDAVDYAENAFDVPVVAYAGADDKQLQAARNIEAKLAPLHIPMTLLVAPGVGHAFPPEWKKKAEREYARHAAKGRTEYPSRIRFVTYTLKYAHCAWVEILALGRHYQRTSVDATRDGDEGFTVKTTNVRALHLGVWPGATRQPLKVKIDGDTVESRPYLTASGDLHLYLERRDNHWVAVLPEWLHTERLRQAQKTTGLQGPIDDAFMTGFLCVRGTGEAWHEATKDYAEANLQRFSDEWSKYLRGDLQVKDDVDVTAYDLAHYHLILLGDPSSNSLIGQVLPALPLKWTRDTITWGGKSYPADKHVPVLIYPSPLKPDHYIVLNSGHTFHAADFRETNAMLYPRLGDHALLKLAPTPKDPLHVEVVRAGLFDDFWRMDKEP